MNWIHYHFQICYLNQVLLASFVFIIKIIIIICLVVFKFIYLSRSGLCVFGFLYGIYGKLELFGSIEWIDDASSDRTCLMISSEAFYPCNNFVYLILIKPLGNHSIKINGTSLDEERILTFLFSLQDLYLCFLVLATHLQGMLFFLAIATSLIRSLYL